MFNDELVQASLDAVMAPHGRSGADALATYRANRPGASADALAAAVEADRMFRVPAIGGRAGGARAQHLARPVRPALHGTKGEFGACHFLEVPFAFDQLDNDQARDRGRSASGPRGGGPRRVGVLGQTRRSQPCRTPSRAPVGSSDPPTMRLDVESAVISDPESDEVALWEGASSRREHGDDSASVRPLTMWASRATPPGQPCSLHESAGIYVASAAVRSPSSWPRPLVRPARRAA